MSYRELECVINEIQEVERKIKSIQEAMQINREKSIFVEDITSINQLF
jgi:hypothetical protein